MLIHAKQRYGYKRFTYLQYHSKTNAWLDINKNQQRI